MKKLLSILLTLSATSHATAQNSQIFTQTARDIWSDFSTAAPMIMAVAFVIGIIVSIIQFYSPQGDWRKFAGYIVVFAVIIGVVSGIISLILNIRLG